MEGVGLVITRRTAVARGRAEHVVGDLDIEISEILRGLRPVADFYRIAANIACREERAEMHRKLHVRNCYRQRMRRDVAPAHVKQRRLRPFTNARGVLSPASAPRGEPPVAPLPP